MKSYQEDDNEGTKFNSRSAPSVLWTIPYFQGEEFSENNNWIRDVRFYDSWEQNDALYKAKKLRWHRHRLTIASHRWQGITFVTVDIDQDFWEILRQHAFFQRNIFFNIAFFYFEIVSIWHDPYPQQVFLFVRSLFVSSLCFSSALNELGYLYLSLSYFYFYFLLLCKLLNLHLYLFSAIHDLY